MMKIFPFRPFVGRLSKPIIGSKLMVFGFIYNIHKKVTIGDQFSPAQLKLIDLLFTLVLKCENIACYLRGHFLGQSLSNTIVEYVVNVEYMCFLYT